LAFKPVLVEEGNDEVEAGLWVDGGVLNNLPLHVFDSNTFGGPQPKVRAAFNTQVLGLQLEPWPESASAPAAERSLGDYLGSVRDTLMFPASGGQILSKQEADRMISVPCGSIGTLDFNPGTQERSQVEEDAEKEVRRRLQPGQAAD
jgi:NTE family protein